MDESTPPQQSWTLELEDHSQEQDKPSTSSNIAPYIGYTSNIFMLISIIFVSTIYLTTLRPVSEDGRHYCNWSSNYHMDT